MSPPMAGADGFPGGAYRANLYVYDTYGRIEWYAIAPQSFGEGRYFTLGRSPDCNIALNDSSVSAHHAYIAAERGELFVRDLGSTNGVLVNNGKVAEAALRHGDVLRMGATDIRFLFSYKDGPVQVLLEFLEGPNAGRTLSTYGSSTTVGRSNCAVNLHGHGLAPQHIRIDAYGPELLYVVNLRRENETHRNGERVEGIATARDGDVLQVGEHSIRLHVVEADRADRVSDEVPNGLGTLQLAADSGMRAQAPVHQLILSADEQDRLEAAHASAEIPVVDPPIFDDSGDRTSLEMPPAAELLEPPKPPAPRAPPLAPSPSPSSKRRPVRSPRDERPSDRHPPVPGDRRPTSRHRLPAWAPAALITAAALLVGMVVLHFIPVRQTLVLQGEVMAGEELPVSSPVRARVEAVQARIGDRVAGRDPLIRLVDLDVEAQLAALAERIDKLGQAGTGVVPPGAVPPVTPRTGDARNAPDGGGLGRSQATTALSEAEVNVATAHAELADATAAFNRREIPFDELERARAKVAATEAILAGRRAAAVNSPPDRPKRPARIPGPVVDAAAAAIGSLVPAADPQERARLQSEHDALEKKLYVNLEAPKGGVLLNTAGPALRVGDAVRKEQRLFMLGEVTRVTAHLLVPSEKLGVVEGAGRALIAPVGFQEPRMPVNFTHASGAAGPDGNFDIEVVLENPNGAFRPGQKVTADVQLPAGDALSWLFGR